MFICSKYLKEAMKEIIIGGKTLRERILKTIFSTVKYIILAKYQLIKSMYKIITSLFLQKPLEAYPNSGIQPN